MSLFLWVIAGAILGLASPLMLRQLQRRREAVQGSAPASRPPGRSRAGSARPRNPFAAVSIRPDLESPCEAVMKTHGQRYLAVKAPPLPVPGCDRSRCGCRYVRHADRRASGGDRRNPFAQFGGYTPRHLQQCRRDRTDRRQRRT